MPFVFKRLVLFLSIAALFAADKPKFQAGPADSYPAHQTSQKVTIAAKVFETDEQTRPAFGKNNPYKHGVLPVLVVMENNTGQTLRLDQMRVEYIRPDGAAIAATPANEVRYISGGRKPRVDIGPTGAKVGRSKNPLDTWEIEGRAFSAKMVPAGESASGFFYFQSGFQSSSKLYITGITEAGSGNELFYFEIPLRDAAR